MICMMPATSVVVVDFSRAIRSAVELATWVTRRSTVIAWLNSTEPTNRKNMIGAIIANSTAATPSALQRARGSRRASVAVGLRSERGGGLDERRSVGHAADSQERQIAGELPLVAHG